MVLVSRSAANVQAQGAEEMEQEPDTPAGRSPASEWLQQFLPCFSGQQQQQQQQLPASGADGVPYSREAAVSASQKASVHQHQADSQTQQQQLHAPLGRGQLFHCWRRKPDSSAAAAAVSRPRRASFHAGQHTQPLSADRVPLHGPGRPLSSDQLSPRPGTSNQPFLSSGCPSSQPDQSDASALLQQLLMPQRLSPREDKTLRKPASAGKASRGAADCQAHHGALQQGSSPAVPNDAVTCVSSHQTFPISRGLQQPEASSDNSSMTGQENLKHGLDGSATSSSGCLSNLAEHPAQRGSSVSSQAGCSESSSRTHLTGGRDACNPSQQQMHEQSGHQQGQEGRGERPGSPTGPHGPLFVPIVLTLEPRDHEVLLREAASRNLVRSCSVAAGPPSNALLPCA